jgi:hypothetical protein
MTAKIRNPTEETTSWRFLIHNLPNGCQWIALLFFIRFLVLSFLNTFGVDRGIKRPSERQIFIGQQTTRIVRQI